MMDNEEMEAPTFLVGEGTAKSVLLEPAGSGAAH